MRQSVKIKFICCRSADTHLLLFCTKSEARCTFLYDKCGNLFLRSATFLNSACYSDNDVCVSILYR